MTRLIFLVTLAMGWVNPVASATRITLIFEAIEIEREDWNHWLADPEHSLEGPGLWKHVRGLMKKKKAALAERVLLSTASGQVAEAESALEWLFLSSGDPPELAETGARFTQRTPTAFESRLIGARIKGDAAFMVKFSQLADQVESRDGLIAMNFRPEIVRKARDVPIGEGPAMVQIPIFETLRPTTSVESRLGEFVLMGSFRPLTPFDKERKNPIVLFFVRGDVSKPAVAP